MAGTLIFVHGTGVREASYSATLAKIAKGMKNHGLDAALKGVGWGDVLGVKLDRLVNALPLEIAAKGIGEAISDQDVETALWSQLVQNPFFELQIAATRGNAARASGVPIPGRLLPEQQALTMLANLSLRSEVLDSAGISQSEFRDAIDAVARSATLAEAARAFDQATDPDLVFAMARAIVAEVLAARRFDPPGVGPVVRYNGAARNELVAQVADALAPGTKGAVTKWLWDRAKSIVKPIATSFVRNRRESIVDDSLPGIGDILLYQRRGEPMREHIAAEIATCEPPVVAVGHSLGGIMLVDLLSRTDHPRVDVLVTVGSQSPLFFIIDALDVLRPTEQRSPFTPWLNIYDRDDFLSFCAERVFGSQSDISDREVASHVPFWDSHSAYWDLDATYQLIREFWPAG